MSHDSQTEKNNSKIIANKEDDLDVKQDENDFDDSLQFDDSDINENQDDQEEEQDDDNHQKNEESFLSFLGLEDKEKDDDSDILLVKDNDKKDHEDNRNKLVVPIISQRINNENDDEKIHKINLIDDNKEKERDTGFRDEIDDCLPTNYPVLTYFYPVLLDIQTTNVIPPDNTYVFIEWENAIIDAINRGVNTINEIKNYVFGSWFLDTSGEFLQFNQHYLNILISEDVLNETLFFRCDDNEVSLYEPTVSNGYTFKKENGLTFKLLVLNTANVFSDKKEIFSIDDLTSLLFQKRYRNCIGIVEYVAKEDKERIRYVLDNSDCFDIKGNGFYKKHQKQKNELNNFENTNSVSDQIINIMTNFAPAGHYFYNSELIKIVQLNGIDLDKNEREELILNEQIFYLNERFGVRPSLKFRKQSKLSNQVSRDILFNILVQVFTFIKKPISLKSLFSLVNDKEFVYNPDSNPSSFKKKKIQNDTYPEIRYFINTVPFIFCQNKKYYMIPLNNEVDFFGILYLNALKFLYRAYGEKIDNYPVRKLVNLHRFPIQKNLAVFIQTILSHPKEIIRKIDPNIIHKGRGKLENLYKIPSSQYNSDFDGNLSDDITHDDVSPNEIHNKKIPLFLNTYKPVQSNQDPISLKFEEKANELLFQRTAKRKKIIQDNVPSDNTPSINVKEQHDIMPEFDENNHIKSELEALLIGQAKKYFNPNTQHFYSIEAFSEALAGKKAMNAEGIDVDINGTEESMELIKKELLNSSFFITNKSKTKFCYENNIGNKKLNQDEEKLDKKSSTKENLIANDHLNINDYQKENVNFSDFNDESMKEFDSESSDNQNISINGIYSMNLGIKNDTWDPPEIETGFSFSNEIPIDNVELYQRNVIIHPSEWNNPQNVSPESHLDYRIRAMFSIKKALVPSNEQLFSLYEVYGNGMSLENFRDFIIERAGMLRSKKW